MVVKEGNFKHLMQIHLNYISILLYSIMERECQCEILVQLKLTNDVLQSHKYMYDWEYYH